MAIFFHVQRKSTLIAEKHDLPPITMQDEPGGQTLDVENDLDPFGSFDTTRACNRQRAVAYATPSARMALRAMPD